MCRYVVLSHRGSNQGCVMFLDYEIGMIFLKGKQISSFCVQQVIFPANIICTCVFVASSRASWQSAPWVYASGGVIFGRSKLPILPGLEPGIPWFVVRCLIHWATGPKMLRKNLQRFYKSSFWLPALCRPGVLRYPGSNLGRVMVQLKCS